MVLTSLSIENRRLDRSVSILPFLEVVSLVLCCIIMVIYSVSNLWNVSFTRNVKGAAFQVMSQSKTILNPGNKKNSICNSLCVQGFWWWHNFDNFLRNGARWVRAWVWDKSCIIRAQRPLRVQVFRWSVENYGYPDRNFVPCNGLLWLFPLVIRWDFWTLVSDLIKRKQHWQAALLGGPRGSRYLLLVWLFIE